MVNHYLNTNSHCVTLTYVLQLKHKVIYELDTEQYDADPFYYYKLASSTYCHVLTDLSLP